MASTEEMKELLAKAVRLTTVFKHVGDGVYRDFEGDDEIDTGVKKLEDYYAEKFDAAEPPKLPTKEELAKERIERLVHLAVLSFHRSADDEELYVNPLTLTVVKDNLLKFKESLEPQITQEIDKMYAAGQSLPEIPSVEEWEKQWKKIAGVSAKEPEIHPVEDAEKVEFEKAALEDLRKINVMDNEDGATDEDETMNVDRDQDQNPAPTLAYSPLAEVQAGDTHPTDAGGRPLGKRNDIVPFMSRYDKSFYIVQLRDYLRLVRRLSNFVKIQKGLMKELTYVEFKKTVDDKDGFVVNHLFFTKDELDRPEINNLIYKNMGLRNLPFSPFDAQITKKRSGEDASSPSKRIKYAK